MESNKLRICKMNENDWFAGYSLNECIEVCTEYYKQSGVIDNVIEDPRELTEEEMDKLVYTDVDGEFGPAGEKYSFRKALELTLEITKEIPPFMFATEDY